ncbi:MAG: ATP-binding protein [Actinomycetota bacterium]|nr:ATP-binding protein [Actinomycetota bacterium]
MRVGGQRPGHAATTAHVQAAYPFVAEGGLGGRGVYVGRDAYGGSFVYDPWELYGRELTSPNMLVIGQIGRAKSSLIKTYLWRQSVFGRRAWVIDPKGEYRALADAFGVEPIALEPGGAVRLNPLTSRAGAQGQLRLLQAVTAGSLRRALVPEEEAGLREALRAVAAAALAEPTLPAIVDALLRPTAQMAAALATTVGELARAVRQAALGLQRLCEGDLRGMFDGPTTPGLDLDAPLVVIDLHAVYDSAALGILMTCAAAWLRAMVDAQTDAVKARTEDRHKLIVVVDEAWRIFSHMGIGEWLQDSFKHSRAYGVHNIIVMHRLSDLRAAGAEGSREARLAEGLLADAETRVIYAQPTDQLSFTRELLGLTETEAELLPTLRRGEALWKVGQRSFLVHHRLSGFEAALVDTDARMAVHALPATPASAANGPASDPTGARV